MDNSKVYRKCSKCFQIRELEEFPKVGSKSLYRRTICKDCLLKRKLEWNKTSAGKECKKRFNQSRKRRLGFIYLNEKSPGDVGHHVDDDHVLYIPKWLHDECNHPNQTLHRKLVQEKLKELNDKRAQDNKIQPSG